MTKSPEDSPNEPDLLEIDFIKGVCVYLYSVYCGRLTQTSFIALVLYYLLCVRLCVCVLDWPTFSIFLNILISSVYLGFWSLPSSFKCLNKLFYNFYCKSKKQNVFCDGWGVYILHSYKSITSLESVLWVSSSLSLKFV